MRIGFVASLGFFTDTRSLFTGYASTQSLEVEGCHIHRCAAVRSPETWSLETFAAIKYKNVDWPAKKKAILYWDLVILSRRACYNRRLRPIPPSLRCSEVVT